MEMNVGMLKNMLSKLPNDMEVFVGCQGYSNYDFKKDKPWEETDTFAIVYDGKLFITDNCAIENDKGIVIN